MRDVGHLNELAQVAEGVIIAGPSTVRPGPQASSDREAVWNFARRTGWPILADVLSGIRGSAPGVTVVDCPDLLARSGHLPEARVILRVGDTPTAKSLRQWWEGSSAEHVLVDPDGRWHDPSHRVTVRIRAGLALLLDQCSGTPDPSWAARWATAGHSAREAVDAALQSETWTEAQVASSLAGHESIKSIVASSSMPVRDLDTFAQASNPVPVLSNRGINGIDGVISTAIGVTRGTEQRQTVYIGDVAVLHDIGGLLDAVRQGIDMTVVVPNNNGGGIFSHLPIRGVLEDSEYVPLFHTPHDTDFSFLGHIEGLTFEQATRESFDSILRSAESRSGISVIECPVETDTSVAHLQRLANAVSTALE
jgi:2-succinyl-5-enolpyruvyl-6-hydroxy-3-cyclohexene-1-carboxylate synthase